MTLEGFWGGTIYSTMTSGRLLSFIYKKFNLVTIYAYFLIWLSAWRVFIFSWKCVCGGRVCSASVVMMTYYQIAYWGHEPSRKNEFVWWAAVSSSGRASTSKVEDGDVLMGTKRFVFYVCFWECSGPRPPALQPADRRALHSPFYQP